MKFYGINWLFSFGFMAILLWMLDIENVMSRLMSADLIWIAVALVAVTVATFSMARRWQIVARGFDMHISYWRALREYYIAQLINVVVPGGVAGDIARAARTRDAADVSRAAQSVLVERILGQFYILGVMCIGFTMVFFMPGDRDWQNLGWVVPMVLISICITIFYLSRTDTATGRLFKVTRNLLARPSMLLHGAIPTGCLILGFYACARATGVVIPVIGWATIVPLVLCAMLIPISVGGWGWREGAAAALFPIFGASATSGLAAGIIYGIVLMMAILPAWIILNACNLSSLLSAKKEPDPL